MRGYDPHLHGMRHTIIAFCPADVDEYDIATWLEGIGFAEATPLMVRSAQEIVEYFKNTITKVTTTFYDGDDMDTILDNVLFEWKTGRLVPITGKKAMVGNYEKGVVIRVYRVR